MQDFKIISGYENTLDILPKDSLNKRFGFVAILDALGIKNTTYEEISQFLSNHISTVQLFDHNFKDILYQTSMLYHNDISLNKPNFLIFQDTVIITLYFEEQSRLLDYLIYFGRIIQYYISVGFVNHILFRGAISYGDYFDYKDNFFFGDAINDASEYYEKPDLIGAITTPKFTKLLNFFWRCIGEGKIDRNKFNIDEFRKLYIRSYAPIKDNTLETFLVSWPLTLAFHGTLPEDNIDENCNALEVFEKLICMFKRPFGTQSKYDNTILFTRKLFENFPDILNIPRARILCEIRKQAEGNINE